MHWMRISLFVGVLAALLTLVTVALWDRGDGVDTDPRQRYDDGTAEGAMRNEVWRVCREALREDQLAVSETSVQDSHGGRHFDLFRPDGEHAGTAIVHVCGTVSCLPP